jgi:hypothetical protein
VIAVFMALAVVVLFGYGYALKTENERLQRKADRQRQSIAALKDSVKKVGEYRAAGEALRSIWGRADRPSDSISAPEPVPGETTRKERVEFTLGADSVAGTSSSETSTPEGRFEHVVTRTLGRRTLRARLFVTPPGRKVEYQLGISESVLPVRLYRSSLEGVQRTYVGAPEGMAVSGLDVSFRRPATERSTRPSAGRSPWGLDFPLGAVRPGETLVGLKLSYRRRIAGPLSVKGYARPMASLPAGENLKIQNLKLRPEVGLSLHWQF